MLNIAHRSAHRSSASRWQQARQDLLERYASAIHRYLLAALGNEHDADDLMQELGLRFLQGRLRSADARKGRFRDFLKKSLVNLVIDYQRRRRRRAVSMHHEPTYCDTDHSLVDQLETNFDCAWREDILARSWRELRRECEISDRPYFAALQLKSEFPYLRSEQLAQRLSRRLGRTVTTTHYRKTLSRARRRMAELMIAQLRSSLPEPSRDDLEEELIALDLLQYCRPVL